MAGLELNGSFAKMRLNVGAAGDRHVGGDANASLAFGEGSAYFDDHKWIASLRCSWELVPTGERYLPPELSDIAREKPELTHSKVQLYSNLLMVFVAMDVRGFDHFWRLFGNHLGDDNILMSIGIPLDDYYGVLQTEKSFRTDLLRGGHVATVASLGVHSRDFDPYVPRDT
jgi:hypothetical protein